MTKHSPIAAQLGIAGSRRRAGWLVVVVSVTLGFASCSPEREPIYRATSLEFVGDWNGDGIGDFAVGDFEQARVSILSGRDGSSLRVLKGRRDFGWSLCGLKRAGEAAQVLAVGSPQSGEVRLFETANDHAISTIKGAIGTFGWALAGVADVDGDFLEDLAIALPKFGKSNDASRGSGIVVSARTGEVLVETIDPPDRELLGFSIASIESQTAGRLPALLVGQAWVPRVVLFDGHSGEFLREFARVGGGVPHSYPIVVVADGERASKVAIANPDAKGAGVVVLFDLDGRELFRWRGKYHGDRFGHALAMASAKQSQDAQFLLVGAPGRIKSAGVALKPVAIKHNNPSDAAAGYVRLYSLATAEMLWEYSRAQAGDWLGIAVCEISDIDADGIEDFIVAGQSAENGRNFVLALSAANGHELYKVELSD